MHIEWDAVTWYSKIITALIFIANGMLWFYVGMQYQATMTMIQAMETEQTPVAHIVPHQTILKNSSSSAQNVDISNWKTYRNEKLGFEIKTPPNWSEQEGVVYSTNDKISASGNTTGTMVIFSSPNGSKNLPIQIFPSYPNETALMSLSRLRRPGVSMLDIKPLIVDGSTFNYYKVFEYIVDNNGSDFEEPALVREDKLYIIQCDATGARMDAFNDCNMNVEELNQLLSTFKFTNP